MIIEREMVHVFTSPLIPLIGPNERFQTNMKDLSPAYCRGTIFLEKAGSEREDRVLRSFGASWN